MVRVSGATYEPEVDEERLRTQMEHVLDVLSRRRHVSTDGDWWTVSEIAFVMRVDGDQHAPEPSISAQIRNLRKRGNGWYQITGRYRKGLRIYEYRLEGRWEAGQGEMF